MIYVGLPAKVEATLLRRRFSPAKHNECRLTSSSSLNPQTISHYPSSSNAVLQYIFQDGACVPNLRFFYF